MDPLFTKQIHFLTTSTRLPLLHGLKKVLSYTNYSFGAIYEAIDGPHCFGCQPFESDQDSLPLLTLLGGERAIGRHAKKHQHRQQSSFKPEELFMLSKIPSEPFSVDDMIPVSLAIGQDGPYSPGMQVLLMMTPAERHIDSLLLQRMLHTSFPSTSSPTPTLTEHSTRSAGQISIASLAGFQRLFPKPGRPDHPRP